MTGYSSKNATSEWNHENKRTCTGAANDLSWMKARFGAALIGEGSEALKPAEEGEVVGITESRVRRSWAAGRRRLDPTRYHMAMALGSELGLENQRERERRGERREEKKSFTK